ncbi:MAG TPA: PDZ domain-containing protein [Casimicrobiaceae bacterium]|nr:PDZ domain-containing protein [Casimicrobiaceae bacterium]
MQMIQATPGSKGRQALLYAGINHLVYGALTIPEQSSAPPAVPMTLSPDALADYAGTYDFGDSVSSRDRQGLADGKTGWLGIGNFVAMEQEGLRINKPNPGGGPATKAGVTAGDLLTEIDDAPLKGLSLADAVSRLRGPANTPIRMKIVHKGQDGPSNLSVVRADRRVNTVRLQVRVAQGKLVAEATGAWPILEFEKGKATPIVAISGDEFRVDGGDHSRIAFVRDSAGKVSGVVLNPGRWEQRGVRLVRPSA